MKNPLYAHIKHQPHDVFLNNPLIQEIGKENKWTVSYRDKDGSKIPTDAKKLVETGYIGPAYIHNGPYPLLTLDELDKGIKKQKDIPYESNRAYRLHSNLNRVIMIDVEPEASDTMLRFAADFPAHYSEISQNGGVHLLIKVPEDLITEKTEYLFDSTVIKERKEKEPSENENKEDSKNTDETDTRKKPPKASYEVLLNNHFVTFTKKMIMGKPIADFENNPEDKKRLETFLGNVVKMDEKQKEIRDMMKGKSVEMDTSDVDMEKVMQIFNSTPRSIFIAKQKNKSAVDYNNDLSRYEMSISTACAGHVFTFKRNLDRNAAMLERFQSLSDNDYVYLVYLMVKASVPARDKHKELRDNIPWLLYTSREAWSFINAQHKKELED